MRRLRSAWRWFASQGPIIVAFVLFAVGGVASALFQVVDEHNEARHDRAQQVQAAYLREQADDLRDELACRARLSSPAVRLESEIARVGWPALAGAVLDNNAADQRAAAARIVELAAQLGPALEQRADAVHDCQE